MTIAGKLRKLILLVFIINTYHIHMSICGKKSLPSFIHFLGVYCHKSTTKKHLRAISRNNEVRKLLFVGILNEYSN